MAQAFPRSNFIGLDYHDASIVTARLRAAEQGVTGNIAFDVKAATACTTSAIRSARSRAAERRSRRTARCCWWSPMPATGWRIT
jgi:hypothetical protein